MTNPSISDAVLRLHCPNRFVEFELSLQLLFVLLARLIFDFRVVFGELSLAHQKGKGATESAHVN